MAKKILHITPWFPSKKNPSEGIFVYNHIDSISEEFDNTVIHIQFETSKNPFKRIGAFPNELPVFRHNRIVIPTLSNSWKEKEIRASKYITSILKTTGDCYDIINFHVPYPLASNIKSYLKKFPNIKFIFNEHWSAFHDQFHLPVGHKGRARIEEIFNSDIKLLCVSEALGKDIQLFTRKKIKFNVLPNILESDFFFPKNTLNSGFLQLCSINNWSSIKQPLFLLKIFKKVLSILPNAKLTLGGDGYMIPEMLSEIETLEIKKSVKVLGSLSRLEVKNELTNADIYIQCSSYETFSIIVAEAIMCGTPAIVRDIGGMSDIVNNENGLKINSQDEVEWCNKLIKMYNSLDKYNSGEMSDQIKDRFSKVSVSAKYSQFLKSL